MNKERIKKGEKDNQWKKIIDIFNRLPIMLKNTWKS